MFEALVSDLAGKLRREVEFVVNKVFDVYASGSGVLKKNLQGRLELVELKF